MSSVFSQNSSGFIWPIDSPFVMTANYGELRPNHFHTGIDFTTHGEINRPIYAIQEGYISRIRVGPTGYGNCVYLTHPGGKVSVYAHLNSFSIKIDKLVNDFRLATQSNEVDLVPKPRSVYVRRNEIIGLSGNTGNSTGPHLHFEIRDELTEVPLNPLVFYKIKDKTAPSIEHLAFYDLADTCNPKFLKNIKVKSDHHDSLYLEKDHLILDKAIIGIAFSGIDRFTSTGSPNNIFSVKIDVDDLPSYAHKLNGIPFPDSRYSNEYSESIGNTKYQKCFLPTIYPQGLYDFNIGKGRILLLDSLFHKVVMTFNDESGNEKKIQFFLKAKKFSYYEEPSFKSNLFVDCGKNMNLAENEISLQITAGSLFNCTYLSIENRLEKENKLIISPIVKLRQGIVVGFKMPAKFNERADKLILKNSSGISVVTVRNDSLLFSIKGFGIQQLMYDTLPPSVKTQYSEKKLKNAWDMPGFSFVIRDELSGISKYNLWMNNIWVPVQYDAKSDLLTYVFDEETPMGLLQFKLEVEDKAGNKTFFEYVLKK